VEHRDAYIADADGVHVVDFPTLLPAVMSYSEPVPTTFRLEELRRRLYTASRPAGCSAPPDLRTTTASAGFCLSHRQLLELAPGDYDVVIDSTLEPSPTPSS
jgi:aminopeptidase-like protein